MSKPFIFGFVGGLVLLIVAGVGASRLHQKNVEQEKHRAELAEYQAEIGDATAVQRGVITQEQRIHSGLYAGYLQRNNNKTIGGFIELYKGTGKVFGIDFLVGLGPLLTEPVTPDSFFGELAHVSDAVIRGRVTNKVSQITEDDGFIFTDYDVVVTEVFKDNVAAPLDTGVTITVTRPGGKVLLDGVIVKARDHCFAPLPMNNHEVVLFLQSVKETGAYKPTRYSGSFELDGLTLRPLTENEFPPGVLRGADSFLQTARAVSNESSK
jgi:hypothetical protein